MSARDPTITPIAITPATTPTPRPGTVFAPIGDYVLILDEITALCHFVIAIFT